ncbi:hypothetical protein BKA64DRAFT_706834 [Cadophora sp. MPI-SDFR-AT-0126]|nr:hypothetical protein BKA64DRAFT_706834 [Leotiomycetes sp. MPI-SDFR-AT-0126]
MEGDILDEELLTEVLNALEVLELDLTCVFDIDIELVELERRELGLLGSVDLLEEELLIDVDSLELLEVGFTELEESFDDIEADLEETVDTFDDIEVDLDEVVENFELEVSLVLSDEGRKLLTDVFEEVADDLDVVDNLVDATVELALVVSVDDGRLLDDTLVEEMEVIVGSVRLLFEPMLEDRELLVIAVITDDEVIRVDDMAEVEELLIGAT